MCGIIQLPGGQRLEIYCAIIDPLWFLHPDPPIDFTRFRFDGDIKVGPGRPDPGKAELTKIAEILASAGHFRDDKISDELGRVAADLGNRLAAVANVDVQFDWAQHGPVGADANRVSVSA